MEYVEEEDDDRSELSLNPKSTGRMVQESAKENQFPSSKKPWRDERTSNPIKAA